MCRLSRSLKPVHSFIMTKERGQSICTLQNLNHSRKQQEKGNQLQSNRKRELLPLKGFMKYF